MISIVIPVYNSEKYIANTIESCMAQTYSDIEIIIIDDCSTDDSVKVVKEKIKYDLRCVLYCNEKNQGVIKTSNLGISKTVGEYIMILGNDDILDKRHVEVFVEKVKEKRYSFLYCASDLIDSDGVKFGERTCVNVQAQPWIMARKNPINACGALINRKCFEAIGYFPEQYRNCGEWYVWIELLKLGESCYVNDIRSQYRVHTANLTKRLYSKENIRKTKEYSLLCMKRALSLPNISMIKKVKYSLFRVIYNAKMCLKEITTK